MDIESSKRREAIQILLDTYGEDNVCQIITYGKYSLKSTIKAIVSFYYNESENYKEINEEINNFTKNVIGTNKINDKEITYDILYEIYNNTEVYLENNPDVEDNDIKLGKKIYEELKVLIDKYPEIEVGLSKLKGAINSIGTHAGGVIISSKSLKNNFPLAKSDGSAILPIIQLEMTDIDFFSLLKLDALGLNTLSQLGSALEEADIPIDFISEEDFNDPKVYEFLRKGNTVNVFQMAKPQATRMLRDFKVKSLHDIMAVTAGVRPGLSNPTDVYGGKSPIDIYLEILNGERQRDYISPEIDKILDKTKGIIWYQEDCQLIGQSMAGYSLGGADSRIRKIIAKKKLKLIPEVRNEFIYGKSSLYNEHHEVIGISNENSIWCKGAINNGYSEEIAKKVFALIEAMAKYAFNKSHAGSYSVLTYKSAYLSLYHPIEYAIGCLKHQNDDKDKQITINYCKSRGIKFLPPNINKSKTSFSAEYIGEEKCIRYGLNKIYKISGVAPFIEFIRDKKLFEDFDDFIEATKNKEYLKEYGELTGKELKSTPVHKDTIENLILAGAFDEFEENRYALINYYIETYQNKKIKETYDYYDEDSYNDSIKYALELAYLDDYASGHPLDVFKLPKISNLNDKQILTFACIVHSTTKGSYNTKNGKREFLKIEFQDCNGIYQKGVIFDPLYSKKKSQIHSTRLPKKMKDKNPKEKFEKVISTNNKRKKCMAIVTGEYNEEFNNFNVIDIKTYEDIFKKG